MNKNMKRVLQALLVMLTMVMLLSMPASAASSKKTVATIGKKSYTSLEAAVKKVKSGQTIKLKKNVKVDTLTLNRNIKYTINLNGYKITRKSANSGNLNVKKGTVTFKNGTIGATVCVYKNAKATMSSVKMQSKYTPKITVNQKGTLTIKSGTYYGIFNYGTTSIKEGTFKSLVYNHSGGTMTIKGGTFKYNAGYVIMNDGEMTISGGTFTNTNSISSESSPAVILNTSGGKLNMSGGTITSDKKSTSAVSNSGTFKMTGGALKASNSDGYALANNSKAKASITGGSLSSGQAYKVYTEITASLSYSSKVLSESAIYTYDPSYGQSTSS